MSNQTQFMKTKYLKMMSVILGLVFLCGCGASSGSSAKSPTANSDENSQPKSNPQLRSACYFKKCLGVKSSSEIEDPQKQYSYPNPKDYPKDELRDQYRAPYAFLDLHKISGTTALSKNLLLQDFAIPEKGRYALVLPALVEAVQKIRSRLGPGLKITSGYRSPGYNSDIDGSATWSRHTYGDAVDLQHSNKSLRQMKNACVAQNATFYLLYSKHIHCDWRAVPLDPAFYPPTRKKIQMATLEANSMALSRESQLVFQRVSDQMWQVAVLVPLTDLEGVPSHEWEMISPSGQKLTSTDAQLLFSPSERGLYHFQVRIGDFFNVEGQFHY